MEIEYSIFNLHNVENFEDQLEMVRDSKILKSLLHWRCSKIKELDVRYIPTEEHIADILTKPFGISRFNILKNKLILAKPKLHLREDVR